jgi:hypothetical protein
MTMIEKEEKLDFRVILRQSGAIELKFLSGTQERFSIACNPEQIGTIAAGLLSAVYGSGQLVGGVQPPSVGSVNVSAAIPVTNWYFGETTPGQKAVVVEVGKTRIAFNVPSQQTRGLGRTMVSASWKTGQVQAPLGALLREFAVELSHWFSIHNARWRSSIKDHTRAFATILKGESFRAFWMISVGPGFKAPEYKPVGKCIYCGDMTYSHDPLIRKHPLGAEHIIAEGLGGTLELPEASCHECEKATGAVVEGDVLGRTMKALRVHLRLKKAGSGSPPKTLPLQATIYGEERTVEIPIEDYPIVFAMFAYAPPNLESTNVLPLVRSAVVVQLRFDQRMLFQKYGIGSFATPYLDNLMMCRMLAKIGHALATAVLGEEYFRPLLTELIRTGDRQPIKFIGGIHKSISASPNALHSLALGYQKIKGTTYLVAHIRLFASHSGPTYAVVIGPSLETKMARLKRVLSSKISRIVGR